MIIPARNEEAHLAEQLDALVAQEWDRPWEIVVVDNRSTDGTAAMVERYASAWPHVRLLRTGQRLGVSYARNVGVAGATGAAVAFCDGDDVVAEGWVRAIGEAVEEHGFVTGALELERLNPSTLAESRGRADEHRAPTFYGIFPSVHGNNFAIERDLWHLLGGYDEGIVAPSAEDVEFSLRAWLRGVSLFFEPSAVVHYRFRRRPGELFRQGRAYGACRPLVARRLYNATRRRPSRLAGWRSWVWLARHVPDVVSRDGRANWAWVAGNRWGHLAGSLRHRMLLL